MKISDITSITRNTGGEKGYYINVTGGKSIHLTKRRTIIALLILIDQGTATEIDIAQGNSTIQRILDELGDRINPGWIQPYYGDANKPYSELWNEEGFTFIDNLKGGRVGLSQSYTLKESDHDKLFEVGKKANRRAPSKAEQQSLLDSQVGRCNLCGAKLMRKSQLTKSTYAKDRRRLVFDHRHPVERGGDSDLKNFQALCFYCNKCKWQICNICEIKNCNPQCALRNPEHSKRVKPTGEDIDDLLPDRRLFK